MSVAKTALVICAVALALQLGRGTTACKPCSGPPPLPLSADQSSSTLLCFQQPPSADVLKEKPSKATLASIYGKIQIVESFPNYKVQVVESLPDLKVQVVDSSPNGPGKWQYVESFPDFKIQFVEALPDFKVQFVTAFTGVP